MRAPARKPQPTPTAMSTPTAVRVIGAPKPSPASTVPQTRPAEVASANHSSGAMATPTSRPVRWRSIVPPQAIAAAPRAAPGHSTVSPAPRGFPNARPGARMRRRGGSVGADLVAGTGGGVVGAGLLILFGRGLRRGRSDVGRPHLAVVEAHDHLDPLVQSLVLLQSRTRNRLRDHLGLGLVARPVPQHGLGHVVTGPVAGRGGHVETGVGEGAADLGAQPGYAGAVEHFQAGLSRP